MRSPPESTPRTAGRVPHEHQLRHLSIDTIRALAMDAVQKANAGHPGTAMALAPLAYTLYTRVPAREPGEPRVARPRPLRALRRPRLRAPVRAAPPDGLRPAARGAAAVPPVGLAHARATPSAATRRGSRRRPARSARAFANAVGMAIAERFLAERFNRPGPRSSSTTTSTRSAPTAT